MPLWLARARPWIVRAARVGLAAVMIAGIIVVIGFALIGASLILPGGVGL